jgi:hypothetical protein
MKIRYVDSERTYEVSGTLNWPNQGEVAIYKSNGNHWVHEHCETDTDGTIVVGKLLRMHYVS